MSEPEMCYVGCKACGCYVCATVDAPDYRAEMAREIAAWARSGLAIERRTVAEARTLIHRCPHGDAPATHRTAAEQPSLFGATA